MMKSKLSSETAYRVLLALYPKTFRQEYGPQMLMDFREMRRDSPSLAFRFWLSIFLDLSKSLPREHAHNVLRYLTSTFSSNPMTRSKIFSAVFAISMAVFAAIVFQLPKSFTSKTLIDVHTVAPNELSVNSLKSPSVLEEIGHKLDLTNRWSDMNRESSVVTRLNESITLKPVQHSSLISVEASDSDAQLAASIVNEFTQSLTKTDLARNWSIVEAATVSERPTSPNIPLVFALAVIIGLLLALVVVRFTDRQNVPSA